MWIKWEQEILQRRADFGEVKFSLNLFVDALGLLPLKSQFKNAALDYDDKHLLILQSLGNFSQIFRKFFTKFFHKIDNLRFT